MKPEQIELITRCWDKLMLLTEVRQLADELVKKNIFSTVEVLNIFSNPDEPYNKESFFRELQNKDETAYDFLVEWLNAINQSKLARTLKAQASGLTPFGDTIEGEEEEDEITSSIETEIPISFNASTTPLKVQVKLSDKFLDTKEHNPHIPYYNSRSKHRGRVLIINNYEFTGTNHNNRPGALTDENNLKELFEQMGGWVVKSKSNLGVPEMKAALTSFTKEKREKRSDICFVFIMSHGSEKLNETIIYGTDGCHMRASDIQEYFKNQNCSLFRGKPKVFIYQVCRGDEVDLPMMHMQYDGRRTRTVTEQNNLGTIVQPRPPPCFFRAVDDMLVGYATMPGSKAHRDPYRGTWYIELICKHFMELAKFESVDNILVKVDDSLRQRMSEFGTVQTAEHIHQGFKKLYLNPGVFEENGRLEKFHPEPIQ